MNVCTRSKAWSNLPEEWYHLETTVSIFYLLQKSACFSKKKKKRTFKKQKQTAAPVSITDECKLSFAFEIYKEICGQKNMSIKSC